MKRRKFYNTRAFLETSTGFFESLGEYVIRTYREGKYLPNYWRGFRLCQTRKPLWTMFGEIWQMAKKWKILPFNYFRNALYDLKTPHHEKYLSFMPEPVLFTRYMPILSPVEYRMLVHNKYFFHQLLKSYGMASPHLMLWSFAKMMYSDDGLVQNDHGVAKALEPYIGESVVFKSQLGARGENVRFLSVDKHNGKIRLRGEGGMSYDFTQLRTECRRLGDWQLEEEVKQHSHVSAIYPSSVNTVRIVTLNYPDGQTKVLAALMRMGRNGSKIDNASAGGIHAHIDVEKGQFLVPAYSKNDNATFTEHPDTHHPFAGVTLPLWEEILDTVMRGAKLFMQTHTIAWDVAISVDGPVIIEGNPTWNPGTMERGSYPKGDHIIAAAEAWRRHHLITLPAAS